MDLAGTETSISFLFFDVSRLFLAEAVTRGEPRYVRSLEPRCRFLLLAQVARPRCSLERPTSGAFACGA
jgi:hypothetical protein